MKSNKSLLILIAVAVWGLAVSYFSGTYAVEKNYEVQTEYTLPQYHTDTARAIDAYQQMINRLLDSDERNNVLILAKLDAIQKDLNSLSARIEKIEKAVAPCQKMCDKKCSKTQKHKEADPNLPQPQPMN